MYENNTDLIYRKVIEVLRLASASADVQLNQFPIQTCRPDEVALTFDEVVSNAHILVDKNFISNDIFKRLLEIDDMYSHFQVGENSDWSENAMYTSTNWEQTRLKARKVIKDMGIEMKSPNLFWITYVV